MNSKEISYNSNPSEVLSKAIIQLIFKEPFYGHVLQSLPRGFTTALPTAAVVLKNGFVEMLFNPDFIIQGLNASERVAVLKHEVLHIVFKHLYRNKKFSTNKFIYNIAADLVVNQYIGNWQLPLNAVRLSSFPELNLTKNQSIEYYIEKLLTLDTDSLSTIVSPDYFTSHLVWDEFSDEASDALKDLTTYKIDRIIIDSYDKSVNNKNYVDLPAEIESAIFNIQSSYRSIVNWRQGLKIFAQHSLRSTVRLTHNRVSKRFNTRPGVKIKRSEKLLLAIDTSGSISKSELEIFFGEIYQIFKCGAEIDIVECDDKIRQFYKYKGVQPDNVIGRGGTNFDPVFEFINSSKVNYDGCIYLTDGYGPSPEITCRTRIMWVLTSDCDNSHLNIGKIIKLNMND